jgi:hypothetical protein
VGPAPSYNQHPSIKAGAAVAPVTKRVAKFDVRCSAFPHSANCLPARPRPQRTPALKLPLPVAKAVNCASVPMVEVLGGAVTEGIADPDGRWRRLSGCAAPRGAGPYQQAHGCSGQCLLITTSAHSLGGPLPLRPAWVEYKPGSAWLENRTELHTRSPTPCLPFSEQECEASAARFSKRDLGKMPLNFVYRQPDVWRRYGLVD